MLLHSEDTIYRETGNTENSKRKEHCNSRLLLIYNKIMLQFILKVAGKLPTDLYQDSIQIYPFWYIPFILHDSRTLCKQHSIHLLICSYRRHNSFTRKKKLHKVQSDSKRKQYINFRKAMSSKSGKDLFIKVFLLCWYTKQENGRVNMTLHFSKCKKKKKRPNMCIYIYILHWSTAFLSVSSLWSSRCPRCSR